MARDTDINLTPPEMHRRQQQMIITGKVVEVRGDSVRVQTGARTSAWLKCATLAAGGDKHFRSQQAGEEVVILNPGGDPKQGIVIASLPNGGSPAPTDNNDLIIDVLRDGTRIEHDTATSIRQLTLPPHGKFVIQVGPTKLEVSAAGIAITAPE